MSYKDIHERLVESIAESLAIGQEVQMPSPFKTGLVLKIEGNTVLVSEGSRVQAFEIFDIAAAQVDQITILLAEMEGKI